MGATIKKTHEGFLQDFKNRQVDLFSKFKVIGKYKNSNTKILIEGDLGQYLVKPAHLLSGHPPTIAVSIDKNKHFIKQAQLVHKDRFDYSLVDYINNNFKVKIICRKHGIFEQQPNSHLQGCGCSKCKFEKVGVVNSNTQEEFITKSSIKHNNKYDYSLVNYTKNIDNIKIICPIHGEFAQNAANHLSGKGCKLCAFQESSTRQSNCASWSYTYWNDNGKNSKNYTGFKLYILKCSDLENKETFYKVGKTFKDVKKRFCNKIVMPYNYSVVKIIESDNGIYISKLEEKLHAQHKQFKYKPLIKFAGDTECFSELLSLQIPRKLI